MVKPKRSAGSAPRATDFVESLDRGLRLLQAFGERASPMTLSEIAAASDLPRATARRILFTLQHGGYVSSDGKLFALTPHVLTLAGAYLRANQVVGVLQPVLDRVAVAAQEISSLAVLDGDDVVFVARGSPTRVFARRARTRLLPAGVLHRGRPRDPRSLHRCRIEGEAGGHEARGIDAADHDRSERVNRGDRRRPQPRLRAGRSRGRAALPLHRR